MNTNQINTKAAQCKFTVLGFVITLLTASFAYPAMADEMAAKQQVKDVANTIDYTQSKNLITPQVNLAKINNKITNLDQKVSQNSQLADAGTATAMAMGSLSQISTVDQNTTSVATSFYNGNAGYAVGVSKRSDNDKWLYKLNAASNSKGEKAVGAGASYSW